MPPTDVHIKTSIERTGKEYKEETHEWIDLDPEKRLKGTTLPRFMNMARCSRRNTARKDCRNTSSTFTTM